MSQPHYIAWIRVEEAVRSGASQAQVISAVLWHWAMTWRPVCRIAGTAHPKPIGHLRVQELH